MPHAVYLEEAKGGSDVDLTTAQVAEKLGVSTRRVRALITAGRLRANKLGRDWMIDSRQLDRFTPMPPGRPPHKD
jgi:excisionase family DNA binding protein